MMRSLLSVFLLVQGSNAMRDPTEPLKEPLKASLKDPDAARALTSQEKQAAPKTSGSG